MARIRAFRGYTYARTSPDISTLASQPYDVISPGQREKLLDRDPHNVVALELPEGPLDPELPGNRYATGATRWDAWRDEGILVRDSEPTLYVLEQRFELNGREVRRKSFIVEVGLEPFDAGVVLPHERTLPKALGDRFNLTKSCAANFSQVFGLFSDTERLTDSIIRTAMENEPTLTATDDDGVVSTVWAVTDPAVQAELTGLLSDKALFIADGHHRYTTALAYRDERRAADEAAGITSVDPDHDFVMMALANMDDSDLIVLPTHRVASAEGDLDIEAFYEGLEPFFEVENLPEGHPDQALDGFDRPAFLIKTTAAERPLRAVLRPEVLLEEVISVQHSSAWKELDVAVLQELILNPLLGIHPDKPETLDRMAFVKNAHDALNMTGEYDVAFILRATRMDQLRSVALGGEIMPQKSTYFYPKVLSGLVMRGME